jgi:hypothetical protein
LRAAGGVRARWRAQRQAPRDRRNKRKSRKSDAPAEDELRQAAGVAQARRERGHVGAATVGERSLVVLLGAAQAGKSAPKQALLVGSGWMRDARGAVRAPAASSPTPPRRGAAG